MPYISNIDLEQRIGSRNYLLLTDDAATGEPDHNHATEARLAAIGEIDSHLATRYRVPIDTAAHPELAALLKSAALDLTEYRLHSRKPPVPADIVRRRNEVIVWLQRIADGLAHLPSIATLESDSSRAPHHNHSSAPRVFSRDD